MGLLMADGEQRECDRACKEEREHRACKGLAFVKGQERKKSLC